MCLGRVVRLALPTSYLLEAKLLIMLGWLVSISQ